MSRQLDDCRTLAKLKELTVDREYVDNDRSATRGNRPAFLELVADVEAGKVDTIICWHTDRLYRRVTDLIRLIEKAKANDLRIFTVKSGDLDLTTPSGRMVAGMLGQAAQYEVEHKGERQKTANLARARQGVRHFANRPYGYVRIDGQIQIVESEAAVIREAVNRFTAGESWYGIAKDLERRGVVGMNGRPFSYQNLRLRVSNPAHAGVRTYLGDVVTEDGDWPPIIDKVTWERFQTALAVRSQRQGWDKKVKYLGSGIFRCGKCGDVMKVMLDYNHGREDHPAVYQCRNFDVRRNLARVDQIVEAAIIDRLSQPDVLRLLSPSEDVSALAAESQDLRARMDGLAELYSEGALTAAGVRTQKDKLQTRLDALQVRIAAAEGGSVVNALAGAKDVAAHWRDKMSILDKRRIVDALMVVTIHPTRRGGRNAFRPEDVAIEWRS